MPGIERETRVDRIGALVQELLAKHNIGAAVGRDDDLRAVGLTSLDMVKPDPWRWRANSTCSYSRPKR